MSAPPPMGGPPMAPPPPIGGLPPAQSGRANLLDEIRNPNLTLKKSERPVAPKPVDARTNLLAEIAKGKQLKKTVINQKQSPLPKSGGNMLDSVHAMLEQRRAVIADDSDSDDDSDGWDDDE